MNPHTTTLCSLLQSKEEKKEKLDPTCVKLPMISTQRCHRRESELCEGTHRPHVAEPQPAALTCPSWRKTHVGGLWVVTQQTLTSACASGVGKRLFECCGNPPSPSLPCVDSAVEHRWNRRQMIENWLCVTALTDNISGQRKRNL